MTPRPNPETTVSRLPAARYLLAAVALALFAVVACTPADPVTQVQQARADYEVALNGFYVEQPAEEEPTEEMASDGMEGEAQAETEDADEMAPVELVDEAAAPSGPAILHMDLLVSTTGETTLDGITVELEHVDAARETKSVRQVWLDTTGVSKGVSATKALQVEIEDFEPEDAFSVEIKVPVPDDEISSYREFAGVGSGS